MTRSTHCCAFLTGMLFLFAAFASGGSPVADLQALVDFSATFDLAKVETRDATVSLAGSDRSRALCIETADTTRWPGITLRPPSGKWNLAEREMVTLRVRNVGERTLDIGARLDARSPNGRYTSASAVVITVAPGSTATLRIRLSPTRYQLTEPVELIGMRRAPVEQPKIDAAHVEALLIYAARPRNAGRFEVGTIGVEGRVEVLDTKTFFPFIDEFGQFIHKEWPGKVHSVEEMKARTRDEEKDLAAHPGPSDWNAYGGWAKGPKLEATGFFRTEKYEGKWWLVDPEGRLFWSHGIDCVRARNATPISDREHYFRLPAGNSSFAQFYGGGSGAPHGYYQNIRRYRTYDFSMANLLRKYGPNWENHSCDLAHRRLRSWGMNTIGNWSDSSVSLMRRTPYTATTGGGGIPIEGSEGYWGKFHDVFDPGFREGIRRSMERERGRSAGDPWCIGYFVHNELGWGDEVSLALATLKSPATQPAKKVFLADLKEKYGTIEKLNEAWGTRHESWDALLQSVTPPDRKKADEDLKAFYTKIAETYFSIIREEVKRVAPHQLYLGCRFAWVNDRAARAAAKFCDVIAYNRYTFSVADQKLPEGCDKPIIIGEFHFGALDRGMFHPGLREVADQRERAAAYQHYVEGALRNPYIVGTHWFQYKDQPTTGRSDGENYQIGFVDICDTPYPETIAASRAVGARMYPYRLASK
ncbi:MAG: beta-galactosidase [Candidatus Sumerlaeia bacterium]|nr:beta-galactosidase [Candidatus Sumerlaeia bacterium]